MKIFLQDRATYSISRREHLDNGFLRVPGRVARTGVQDYLAGELKLKDRKPGEVVRVFRPPEEVFKQDSLDSYKSVDVTVGHPNTLVDAKSFKRVSVGHVEGSGVVDGDFIECVLIVKDAEAIKNIESGKVQLSAGYTALYDDNVPEGADYEFIQRDIRINHVALVDRARAGAQARLFDNKPEDKHMFIVSLGDGLKVEVSDEASKMKIESALSESKKAVGDAETRAEKLQATADSLQEQLTAAKAKCSDEAINDRLREIALVKSQAMKIAGPDFSCDSLNPHDNKVVALTMTRDSMDWTEKSETYVEVAFDMALKEKESDDEDEDEMASKKNKDRKRGNDSHAQLSQDASVAPPKPGDARKSFTDSLSKSWKGGDR